MLSIHDAAGTDLQTFCDQIITQLEKAVRSTLWAQHIKSDIEKAKLEAEAETNKNDYFNILRNLYRDKELPPIYTEVYNLAISQPMGTSTKRHINGASYSLHASYIYKIEAARIIRQLNNDFLANQPRNFWVSYHKPHLNFLGKTSYKSIGALDYKMCWLNEPQQKQKYEDKTIDLNIIQDGLSYTIFEANEPVKIGKISFREILEHALPEVPLDTSIYQPIDMNKNEDGLTYRVQSPKGDIQGQLSFNNILELVKIDPLKRPDSHMCVIISEENKSSSADCYSFIMRILSHLLVQIVAMVLLVLGAVLALSGISLGIGGSMVFVGAGILIAGFFAPQRASEPTSDFFAPNKAS